jgi:hypothetical protein
MSMIWEKFAAIALCVAVSCGISLAQVPPVTILEIDFQNTVTYFTDVFDISKFATDPNVTTPTAARNFRTGIRLSDIVAVNGRPVRGTHVAKVQTINLNTEPTPGQAIADTVTTYAVDQTLQVMQPDGTPIGSIMASGFSAGPADREYPRGDFAIVGGTGAFLGVRGQFFFQPPPSGRMASVTEDPANRRKHGGGPVVRYAVLHLFPMSRPEIVSTPNGPSVLHSDFSPVTAAKPARAGEVLIAVATGLGPTRPGVDPGKPFPPSPPFQEVNSPVEVTVNGQAAEVVNKVGWPGSVDTYRVDFRIPEGAAAGTTSIQLIVAWIVGPEVKISVQ